MQWIVQLLRTLLTRASDHAPDTALWGSRVSKDDIARIAAAVALASKFDLAQLVDNGVPESALIQLYVKAFTPDQWREIAAEAAEDIVFIEALPQSVLCGHRQ